MTNSYSAFTVGSDENGDTDAIKTICGEKHDSIACATHTPTACVSQRHRSLSVDVAVMRIIRSPRRDIARKKIISCARDGFSCALYNFFLSRCPFAAPWDHETLGTLVLNWDGTKGH